jgi:copper resistance protein C
MINRILTARRNRIAIETEFSCVPQVTTVGRPTFGHRSMRIILFTATLLALLAGLNQGAQAHAMLDHANPRVGNTVHKAPREIVLWFTEEVEPAFSGIEVRDINGQRVDAGKAHIDRTNHAALRIAVKPLPPGTYNVHWHVLSVDTHRTQGDFLFHVAK